MASSWLAAMSRCLTYRLSYAEDSMHPKPLVAIFAQSEVNSVMVLSFPCEISCYECKGV